MKFNANTIKVLNNFMGINTDIKFAAGTSHLVTYTKSLSLVGVLKLDEEFDTTFGTITMNKMLSALSFFDAPDVMFDGIRMLISEGKKKMTFIGASVDVIECIRDLPLEKLEGQDCIGSFNLSSDLITELKKVTAAHALDYISFSGSGTEMTIRVFGKNTANDYEIVIGSDTDVSGINMVIPSALLKIMNASYTFDVSARLSKLTCLDDGMPGLCYYVRTYNPDEI
jgi:hypothetical protein